MFDSKLKERIIREMCSTYSDQYDLELIVEIIDDDYLGGSEPWEKVKQGMRPAQKQFVYNRMKQIFENCIEKYIHFEVS